MKVLGRVMPNMGYIVEFSDAEFAAIASLTKDGKEFNDRAIRAVGTTIASVGALASALGMTLTATQE